jgi:hypothetical protein
VLTFWAPGYYIAITAEYLKDRVNPVMFGARNINATVITAD